MRENGYDTVYGRVSTILKDRDRAWLVILDSGQRCWFTLNIMLRVKPTIGDWLFSASARRITMKRHSLVFIGTPTWSTGERAKERAAAYFAAKRPTQLQTAFGPNPINWET